MESEPVTTSVSLEEPSEIVGQVSTPEPETQVIPPVSEDEPEGVVFAANGQKLVPLGAVKAERERRQTAEAALKAKDAEIAPLIEKAKNWDETKTYLEQARPAIEKARADLQRPKEPVAPVVDERVVQYAKDFDLYTADGKPDVDRATRIMKFHADEAQKYAQQAVAPILQKDAHATAQHLYQQYASRPEVNGIKVDGRLLAEAFNMVGPDVIAANPNVAEVLYMNTIGRQMLSGQKPIVAPSPVVTTESVGGGITPESHLTPLSDKFIRAAGTKPSVYKEAGERYKAGQPNSLE